MNNIEKEMETMLKEIRDDSIVELYQMLGISEKKMKKTNEKVLNLHPKSMDWIFLSELYRYKHGKYSVKSILDEYFMDTIRMGFELGMCYGKKFFTEDIQSKRFSLDDIIEMNDEEMFEYTKEERDCI